MKPYYVVEYTKNNQFVGVIAGMGRNKDTWDTDTYCKRTAQRWAAKLRKQYPESIFKVESNY